MKDGECMDPVESLTAIQSNLGNVQARIQEVVNALSGSDGTTAKGGITSVTIHYADGTTGEFDLEAETSEDTPTPTPPAPEGEAVMTPGTQAEG